MSTNYEPVRNQPVARFFYKGTHTHPVRRTVVIVENNSNTITGYELREGMTMRSMEKAPIKSYRKDTIALVNQLDKRRKLVKTTPKKYRNQSTLSRTGLFSLVTDGI